MSKIEELKEFLKPKDEKWLYDECDEITQEEIVLMRNATTKQKMNLFKKNDTGHPFEYNVHFVCTECGKNVIENWNKTKILDKTRDFVCDKCVQKKEYEKEMKRKLDDLDDEKQTIENTKYYIENYLNPDKSWKEGMKQWEKWKEIRWADVEHEIIANYIKGMNYHDFLKTPYWKAVSGQVKKNNDYKCQLCGKQGTLNVHHSDYSIHGYEVQKINKLLCLCSDCHNNFHKITNKQDDIKVEHEECCYNCCYFDYRKNLCVREKEKEVETDGGNTCSMWKWILYEIKK